MVLRSLRKWRRARWTVLLECAHERRAWSIAENVAAVRERIASAPRRGKRRLDEITLIGISKGVPAECIREAFHAGVRHFGESRVQEWESKAPATGGSGGHLAPGRASAAQ